MSRAKLEALIDSAMQQIKTALLNEFDEVVKAMKKDELEKLKQKEQDVLQRQIQETKISAAIEQSRMPSGDRYFSIKEIAETGLCSEPTIKRWIASGKLKSYKFGRSRKVAESDLNAYLAICKQ